MVATDIYRPFGPLRFGAWRAFCCFGHISPGRGFPSRLKPDSLRGAARRGASVRPVSRKKVLSLLQSRGRAWLSRLLLPSAPSPASGERNFHPNYRPDIDGLRALAILPVVGFHAFPNWFPGGFVGVDVFFVISGFLISTIIFKSLDRSDFSFVEFYARRIRRIFPALLVVLAACFVLGRHMLLGGELEMLGRHIAAGAGFVQNFVLWNEAGYFDVASELKPMLHLWSLAVEEQFYLAFPLMMWATWRLRINLLIPVIVIFLASFAANLHGIGHDAVATFFAPQTRFWELMAGAMLAWFARGDTAGSDARRQAGYPTAVVNSIVSFVGLSLVLLAIFGLDRSMPYPGVWALLPVLGTVLLILSGPAASVNRFMLSNRFAVSVGRISYPLYLWHWPLLSFLTIINGGSPDGGQRFLAVLLSFILAWLTFRFIERPVRESNRGRKLVTGNLVLGIGAMGVLGLNAEYFARTYDEPIRKIVQVWEFSNYPGPPGGHNDARYNLLTYGNNDKEKILIIGESHALLELLVDLETGQRLHGLILSPMRSIALARALSDSAFLISRSAFAAAQAFTSARCAA